MLLLVYHYGRRGLTIVMELVTVLVHFLMYMKVWCILTKCGWRVRGFYLIVGPHGIGGSRNYTEPLYGGMFVSDGKDVM